MTERERTVTARELGRALAFSIVFYASVYRWAKRVYFGLMLVAAWAIWVAHLPLGLGAAAAMCFALGVRKLAVRNGNRCVLAARILMRTHPDASSVVRLGSFSTDE